MLGSDGLFVAKQLEENTGHLDVTPRRALDSLERPVRGPLAVDRIGKGIETRKLGCDPTDSTRQPNVLDMDLGLRYRHRQKCRFLPAPHCRFGFGTHGGLGPRSSNSIRRLLSVAAGDSCSNRGGNGCNAFANAFANAVAHCCQHLVVLVIQFECG